MSQNKNLAVTSQSGESLSFFNLETYERTSIIENMVAEPHELCLDRHRNVVYVSHAYRHGHFWAHGDNGHEISVVDLAQRKVVGFIDIAPYGGPHGLRLDAENDVLYSSVEHGCGESIGGVIGIDLKSNKVIGAAGGDAKCHWAIITPGGTKAYTCNKTIPYVSVLDLKSWKLIKKIEVPGSEELDISPDGRFVYVSTPSTEFGKAPVDPCVKVIDTATDEIVKSVPLAHGPSTVHVTSRGTILVGQYRFGTGGSFQQIMDSSKPGKLSVFEPGTFKLLGEIDVGLYPLTVRSSDDGSKGFAANVLGGTVAVVDLDEFKVLKTLDVDLSQPEEKKSHQGAHGMAVF